MNFKYDAIVIGCGPGGYSAGVTCARMGAKVCIIEKDEIGGICVNKGCIPTKTILSTALIYYKLKETVIDYTKILNRVKDVVTSIRKQMLGVINANKIDLVRGKAELTSEDTIKINNKEIKAKKIIIATGSRPKALKNLPFNNRIFSGEDFLGLERLPRSVLIAGAGAIGCEWASLLASLGVSVTLAEIKDRILPEEDSDLTKFVESNLKKMGVEVRLNTTVTEIAQEKAIICIGREPVTDGFGMLETKDGGWIKVNKYMQTSLPSIYAIGDVIGPPLLAYTAQAEGVVSAHNALGKEKIMDYRFIPRVIFSIPELASVGAREYEVSDASVVRAYFKGLGKALADGESSGFVKIIYEKSNYKLLGVGIVGKDASELINEATIALKFGLTVNEWATVVHPHPVLSEIFGMALEKIK